jgi:competence protein ComEA
MQQLRALAAHKIRIAIIAVVIGVGLLAQSWINQTSTKPIAALAPEQGLAESLPEDGGEIFDEPMPTATAPEAVIVYVSGAVRAPDVYSLPAEARVKDLVLAAGGFAPEAAAEQINLAERLRDGEHIHIPRQGDLTLPQSSGEAGGGTQDAAPDSAGPIDINTAGAAELDTLPGVGQTLAQRIIEHRSANGPFTSVEELRNVKGIGPALFAQIAPLVTVGP